MPKNDAPIPWEANYRARRMFNLLSETPMSTLDLLDAGFIHPARQVWELRHWYGKAIKTGRTRANVAVYSMEREAVAA